VSSDNQTTAQRIWEFIFSKGPQGAIADEVLASMPELGHTMVTARIYGLKHARLIVRHPDGIVRKTRKGRTAEVWVVRRGVRFNPEKYREPKAALAPPPSDTTPSKPCLRRHVTEEEFELLELARSYGETPSPKLGDVQGEAQIDGIISALFDKICQVYPVKKGGR
jgi:hypothetical protein